MNFGENYESLGRLGEMCECVYVYVVLSGAKVPLKINQTSYKRVHFFVYVFCGFSLICGTIGPF